MSFRIPQYMYPSAAAAYVTHQGVFPVAPHSPLSPTANSQLFDYSAAVAAAGLPTTQLPAAYEAAYPYTTAAAAPGSGYVAPTAAYSYAAAVPQQMGLAAHYQPQQLQERMQWVWSESRAWHLYDNTEWLT